MVVVFHFLAFVSPSSRVAFRFRSDSKYSVCPGKWFRPLLDCSAAQSGMSGALSVWAGCRQQGEEADTKPRWTQWPGIHDFTKSNTVRVRAVHGVLCTVRYVGFCAPKGLARPASDACVVVWCGTRLCAWFLVQHGETGRRRTSRANETSAYGPYLRRTCLERLVCAIYSYVQVRAVVCCKIVDR